MKVTVPALFSIVIILWTLELVPIVTLWRYLQQSPAANMFYTNTRQMTFWLKEELISIKLFPNLWWRVIKGSWKGGFIIPIHKSLDVTKPWPNTSLSSRFECSSPPIYKNYKKYKGFCSEPLDPLPCKLDLHLVQWMSIQVTTHSA